MITPTLPALRPPFIGPTGGPINGGARSFGSLFRNRTGIWYDPQDLTTMYQDAAGTLPVYRPGSGAVDPPVGLLLDKSKGLELGPELVVNGDFSDGATGWSPGSSAQLEVTSDGLIISALDGDSYACAYTSFPTEAGKTYRLYIKLSLISGFTNIPWGVATTATSMRDIYSAAGDVDGQVVFMGTGSNLYIQAWAIGAASGVKQSILNRVSVREIKGNHAYQTTTTARPKLSGRYNLLTSTETLSTQSVTTAATDYTLRFEGTGTVTLSGTATGVLSAGTHTVACTAGTLTLTVAGSVVKADLRAANDGVGLPPYQRVDDANTYDTNGFPLYLQFDGVDDYLQTANVDLTGTDKVTAGVGLRKLSVRTIQSVVQFRDSTTPLSIFEILGNSNTTSKALEVGGYPELGTHGYFASASPSVAAVATAAVVGLADFSKNTISEGRFSLFINSTKVSPTASNLGTGNGSLGIGEVYVGRRGGTYLPFSGRIYSLCIIGALLSTSEQAVLEQYLNAKTRAY